MIQRYIAEVEPCEVLAAQSVSSDEAHSPDYIVKCCHPVRIGLRFLIIQPQQIQVKVKKIIHFPLLVKCYHGDIISHFPRKVNCVFGVEKLMPGVIQNSESVLICTLLFVEIIQVKARFSFLCGIKNHINTVLSQFAIYCSQTVKLRNIHKHIVPVTSLSNLLQ